MPQYILLVEGRRCGRRSWAPALKKRGYSVTKTYTRRETQAQLQSLTPDLIVVDSRFLRFDPIRFFRSVREDENEVPFILILKEGKKFERGTGINIQLREPFTARKLLNRVKRLLPTTSERVLKVGDIALDLQQRTVSQGGSNHRLTPKQAHLLEVLMRHPGQVLSRSFLMKQVWNTDFVGDTRTLEVHIHWLRRAIEEDSSNPIYLTTLRGVGYRFGVPSEEKDEDSEAED